MQGFVYILKNSENKFYVGSTDNIDRRMYQHSIGHTQTTRNMKDFKMVFSQCFSSLAIARTIEQRIKKLKRRDYLDKIVRDGYIKMTF